MRVGRRHGARSPRSGLCLALVALSLTSLGLMVLIAYPTSTARRRVSDGDTIVFPPSIASEAHVEAVDARRRGSNDSGVAGYEETPHRLQRILGERDETTVDALHTARRRELLDRILQRQPSQLHTGAGPDEVIAQRLEAAERDVAAKVGRDMQQQHDRVASPREGGLLPGNVKSLLFGDIGKQRATHHSPTPSSRLSSEATAPSSDKTYGVRLVMFTTLKSCDSNETIRYAQLDALSSWLALPLTLPPRVVILASSRASSTCEAWIVEQLNTIKGSRATLLTEADGLEHGKHSGKTVLLGSSMRLVEGRFSDADVFGFINADILLEPTRTAFGLGVLTRHLKVFFAVGRRKSVRIELQERASYMRHRSGSLATALLDFTSDATMSNSKFQRAVADRVDAEDYFFWSRGFFSSSPHQVPNFHIGRPAYDNWLVHHAIHTWQPVVDASRLLIAFHQSHGYQHLEQQHNDSGHSGERASTATYWGSQEQQENYDLGLSNGGWRHGLIDFCPLSFHPQCEQVRDGAMTKDAKCGVELSASWHPLDDEDAFSKGLRTRRDYELHYQQYRRYHA